MQLAPEANKRRDLRPAALGFEIGVFVEERLLGGIEFAERGPIDLPAEKGLRIEFAAARRCGTFERADRHPVLIEDAQFELVDDRALGRARFMHRQAEIARRGRAPPEAVGVAVAGRDATDLAEVLAVVGEMHGEDGAVGLSPRDERAERGADIAEIDGDAFPRLDRDWLVAERVEAAQLENLGRIGGVVQIDLDDLNRLLEFERLADKADEAHRDRREGENVLSALAMARPAKPGPDLPIRRTFEPINGWRLLAPVDL